MYYIMSYLGPNITNMLPISAYPDTLHKRSVTNK